MIVYILYDCNIIPKLLQLLQLSKIYSNEDSLREIIMILTIFCFYQYNNIPLPDDVESFTPIEQMDENGAEEILQTISNTTFSCSDEIDRLLSLSKRRCYNVKLEFIH